MENQVKKRLIENIIMTKNVIIAWVFLILDVYLIIFEKILDMIYLVATEYLFPITQKKYHWFKSLSNKHKFLIIISLLSFSVFIYLINLLSKIKITLKIKNKTIKIKNTYMKTKKIIKNISIYFSYTIIILYFCLYKTPKTTEKLSRLMHLSLFEILYPFYITFSSIK